MYPFRIQTAEDKVSLLRLKDQIVLFICVPAAVVNFNQPAAGPHLSNQQFVTTCGTDLQISDIERATVNDVAMQFVKTVLSPNPGAAYSRFTADAQRNVQEENFTAMILQGIHPLAPFKELRVVHTYLPKVIGGANRNE